MKCLPTILALAFVFTACFDLQNTEIEPPVMPNYTLSGYAVDVLDTNKALEGIPVTLTPISMIYAVTFTETTVFSDSEGYFHIDSVFPGEYTYTAERGGYITIFEDLVMTHRDSVLQLGLPEPLTEHYFYRGPSVANPTIEWDSNNFWSITSVISLRISDGRIPAIMQYGMPETLLDPALISGKFVRAPTQSALSLEIVGGTFYWLLDGQILECLYAEQTIYDATVDRAYVPEHAISGMDWDGSNFWTVHGSRLEIRSRALDLVDNWWPVDATELTSIAVGRDQIWAWDDGRDLLLRLSPEGEVLLIRRLINSQTGVMLTAFEIDFSIFGTLWVSVSGSGTIFDFDVTAIED